MTRLKHQYVERETSRVMDERLFADRVVNMIYSEVRENAGFLFDLVTSKRVSGLLGFVSYDIPLGRRRLDPARLMAESGIDLSEALDAPEAYDTYRKVFERKIRYWDLRPLAKAKEAVAAPADAKLLPGSLGEGSALFIKDKFFEFTDLLGRQRDAWLSLFAGGDYAICRLTPDKYHYNHVPVSGRVVDIYEVSGAYHSCNPGAVVRSVSPYSRNRRVVTVIDTDVPGGSGIGRVAMVEIVALMIGEIVQCYSKRRYDAPADVTPGLFMEKGRPKSLFRPGSSTTVLLFEKGKVRFSPDLVENAVRKDVTSRFSAGFGRPLVETDVRVRSEIARAAGA